MTKINLFSLTKFSFSFSRRKKHWSALSHWKPGCEFHMFAVTIRWIASYSTNAVRSVYRAVPQWRRLCIRVIIHSTSFGGDHKLSQNVSWLDIAIVCRCFTPRRPPGLRGVSSPTSPYPPPDIGLNLMRSLRLFWNVTGNRRKKSEHFVQSAF